MALTIRAKTTTSVFGLQGADENSGTFALGWVLEQSAHFRRLVIEAIFGEPLDPVDTVIALQKHDHDGGFTDLELQAGHHFHAILEAKRWWEVPGVDQLARYQPRLQAGRAERQRLVSVSAADAQQAMRALPDRLGDVAVTHLSWSDLQRLARRAISSAASFEERLWLRQLDQHLQEFVAMDRITDNRVYVVALSSKPILPGNRYTWIDVVEQDATYFHPVGNTWPVQPPNYIGFRYRGQLQSVHRIAEFQIVRNLASVNPLWPTTETDIFIYRLGPPMYPEKVVKAGIKIFRGRRVWCAIDTLLSGEFETISDALDETLRRQSEEL